VVHWGFKRVRGGLAARTLPLAAVPSVAAALAGGAQGGGDGPPLACSDIVSQPGANSDVAPSFADWEAQHKAHGACSFMVSESQILSDRVSW
jgi:hypothetical protein